jgi:carbohydrate kinase (thermoresistant glucokinase family)
VIVLVMGVSGAGKTTIGRALAQALGCEFIDAGDHHPPANVAKMAAGVPLEDADRWPWLFELNSILKTRESAVVACSALKQSYRDVLSAGLRDFRLVFLHGGFDLIRARTEARPHRYMLSSLLESQFAELEPPAAAIAIDVSADAPACVEAIVEKLAR